MVPHPKPLDKWRRHTWYRVPNRSTKHLPPHSHGLTHHQFKCEAAACVGGGDRPLRPPWPMTAPPETAATRKKPGGDEEARPLAHTCSPERRQRRIPPPRGASPPVRAAPRRRRLGGPCSCSCRGFAGVGCGRGGCLGTAWRGAVAASGRGFRRRQAVDLSRRLHFVSSVFRSGTSTPHHLSPSRPLALRACVYKRSARFGRSLVPDLTSAGAACSDQLVRWVLGNFRL